MLDFCVPPTSENAARKLPNTNTPANTVEIRNMRRLNFFIGCQGLGATAPVYRDITLYPFFIV